VVLLKAASRLGGEGEQQPEAVRISLAGVRTVAALLRHVLTQSGFSVCEASHGAEAMKMLTSEELPDLITLDWNMPVMNGGATLEAIRQNHAYDKIKVLVVSSETERSMVADALRYGTDDYLMKPFSLESFYEKIELLGFSLNAAGSNGGK
jgi:two-component system chemotaxis response regulator CheY